MPGNSMHEETIQHPLGKGVSELTLTKCDLRYKDPGTEQAHFKPEDEVLRTIIW